MLEIAPLPPPRRGRPSKAPAGLPSIQTLDDPGNRFKILVQKHSAPVVLRALKDEKFLAQNFTVYDGMLIMALGNALKGSGDERERIFNRMFGKVPDKQINMNINLEISPDKLTQKASDMLARIGGADIEND